jgi:hypothetical protein
MDTKCKKCSLCNIVKDYSEFYSDKRKSDGLYARCKACFNSAQKNKIDKMIDNGERLPRKYSRMSTEVKEQILQWYNTGVGCYTIAKKYSTYRKSSILKFLKKQGELREGATFRKYKFKNENYFDNIDTDEKAYFLGFLWADGCNYRNDIKNKQAYQITISIQERDGYILNTLANKIYFNDDIIRLIDMQHVVKYQPFPNETLKMNKLQNLINLRIPSKHISDTLLNYGMIPRKSSILEMPVNLNLSPPLMKAFIRGFYDGDGGISKNTGNNRPTPSYIIGFISSVIHMQQMNEIIKEQYGEGLYTSVAGKYSVPMGILKLSGNQKVINFLDWLYEGSTIHLDRKYKKYLELKDMVISNPRSKMYHKVTTKLPLTSDQE